VGCYVLAKAPGLAAATLFYLRAKILEKTRKKTPGGPGAHFAASTTGISVVRPKAGSLRNGVAVAPENMKFWESGFVFANN